MNIGAVTYNPFTSPYGNSSPAGGVVPNGLNETISPAANVTVSPAGGTAHSGTETDDHKDSQATVSEKEETTRQGAAAGEPEPGASEPGPAQLTEAELKLVEKLQQIDQEVRRHEMAHMAAGGSLITSAASFTYQQGPDGRSYAVGGEVGIDTSPVPGDPEATARKMRQVRAAALAPGDPSAQDLKVAASAAAEIAKAQSEMTMLKAKEQAAQSEESVSGTGSREAADTYSRVGNLPETESNSFRIAV